MAAANTLLPELVEEFQRFEGGIEGLLELVDQVGGGNMAQAIMVGEPVDPQPGVMILARIRSTGGYAKPVSPGVAAIDPELRQRMLPFLAMLLGGYLSARAVSGGLDETELASLLEARKSFYSPGDEPV